VERNVSLVSYKDFAFSFPSVLLFGCLLFFKLIIWTSLFFYTDRTIFLLGKNLRMLLFFFLPYAVAALLVGNKRL